MLEEKRLGSERDRFGCAMVQVRYVLGVALVSAAAMFSSGCRGEPPSGSGAREQASSASARGASPGAPSSDARDADREVDEAKPVYPQTQDPPDPAAERYCNLIYESSEQKRKECCPAMNFTGFRPTGECVRTLSYALRSKAVALDPKGLDACEAAITEEAKRCDWGGSIPAACEELVRGALGDREACRSSLECKEGLHCAGLGTTRPGKCAPAFPVGARCGGGPDSLGAFVRQDAERSHPECEGYCDRRVCAATVPPGKVCKSSVQCGRGLHCVRGGCTDAPLPSAGGSCADVPCAPGSRCVRGGCVVEKRLGDVCASDEECRSGACDAADGGPRACTVRCTVFRP